MCWGLHSHYFPVVGDGHQPNRGLYTGWKDSMTIPNIRSWWTLAHIGLVDFTYRINAFAGELSSTTYVIDVEPTADLEARLRLAPPGVWGEGRAGF